MDWLNMTPEEAQAMRRIPANSHSGNGSSNKPSQQKGVKNYEK